MGKARIQLLLVAFCLGVVNSQYSNPNGASGGYGLPTGYGNPGYAGSVGYGSNELGAGYQGVNSGYNPSGVSAAGAYNPAGISSQGAASGAPGAAAAGATGNPNNRIFGLLSGGGLFGGRGGGLLSNLFGGGNRYGSGGAGGYPIAYPVPVASPGFGGFGGFGGGYPGYGGGFYG